MRLATIDLGTNTVRLLVADIAAAGRWTTVVQDQRVTRLGEGLRARGRLAEAPMNRTAATVTEYGRRAREAGAGSLRSLATSGVSCGRARPRPSILRRRARAGASVEPGGDREASRSPLRAHPGRAWAPDVPRAGPRRSHRAWRRHRPRQPRRHADGCGRGERLGIAGRYHGRNHRAALMM